MSDMDWEMAYHVFTWLWWGCDHSWGRRVASWPFHGMGTVGEVMVEMWSSLDARVWSGLAYISLGSSTSAWAGRHGAMETRKMT